MAGTTLVFPLLYLFLQDFWTTLVSDPTGRSSLLKILASLGCFIYLFILIMLARALTKIKIIFISLLL